MSISEKFDIIKRDRRNRKKKGFTLIELLAVIVILAIIALIATPIVLNIIKDTSEQARRRSLDMYIKATGNAVAQYQLKTGNKPIEFENIKDYIRMDNTEVNCDGKLIDGSNVTLQNCKVNNEVVMEDFIYGNVCVAVNENTATYRIDDTTKTVGYIATNVPTSATLYNATKDWDNISNINIDYVDEGGYYGGLKTTNNITSIIDSTGNSSASFTNLKARLAKEIELTNLGCTAENNSCPIYLINYLEKSNSFGTSVDYASYYILSTRYCGGNWVSRYGKIFYQDYNGANGGCSFQYEVFFSSVRPVITLPKNLLSY